MNNLAFHEDSPQKHVKSRGSKVEVEDRRSGGNCFHWDPQIHRVEKYSDGRVRPYWLVSFCFIIWLDVGAYIQLVKPSLPFGPNYIYNLYVSFRYCIHLDDFLVIRCIIHLVMESLGDLQAFRNFRISQCIPMQQTYFPCLFCKRKNSSWILRSLFA